MSTNFLVPRIRIELKILPQSPYGSIKGLVLFLRHSFSLVLFLRHSFNGLLLNDCIELGKKISFAVI